PSQPLSQSVTAGPPRARRRRPERSPRRRAHRGPVLHNGAVQLLAAAAEPSNLIFARFQMALSLGWHIVVACLGVGFPPVILIAEALGLRRGDTVHRGLARRWARAAAALFALGA